MRVDTHGHGIHNDCEKVLKKWMHFASGLKNDLQELETFLCANVIILFFFFLGKYLFFFNPNPLSGGYYRIL